MNRKWHFITLLALSATLLVSCLPRSSNLINPHTGTVTVCGSSSAWRTATILLEAFTLEYPYATATYTNGGSAEGMLGVNQGVLDVAIATNVNSENMPDTLEAIAFGYDGVAIIVHPDNPVDNLTTKQVKDIAAGRVTNWAQVGGEDRPIQLMGLQESNGTRWAFETYFEVESPQYAAVFMGEGGIHAEVAHNPNAIGCITGSSIDRTIKPVSLDDIQLEKETLKTQEYPLLVVYHLVYNPTREQPPTVDAFIQFFLRFDMERLARVGGIYTIENL